MTRPSRTPAACERGFTLAEVLVALAIVAAIGGGLASTIAQNAHATAQLRDRRNALLLAQSALDRAAAGDPASDGAWQSLHWHVARTAYGAADPLARVALEEISVRVSDDGRAPLVTLATVRLRP